MKVGRFKLMYENKINSWAKEYLLYSLSLTLKRHELEFNTGL